MNHRADVQTLERLPRLNVAAALAGGPLALGAVLVKAVPGAGAVSVTWRRPGGGGGRQRLALARYTPGLGGVVTLFECACGGRVRSLYLAAGAAAWACRGCLGLRYQSQRVHYPGSR